MDTRSAGAGASSSGIPVAALAFVVLQKTLHLPVVKREVHIDYLGATLLVAGVSILLIWVSLAGHNFDWVSTTTALLVGAGVAGARRGGLRRDEVANEPVIPLRLFRDRTTSLATVASVHDRRRDVRLDGLPVAVLPAAPAG